MERIGRGDDNPMLIKLLQNNRIKSTTSR